MWSRLLWWLVTPRPLAPITNTALATDNFNMCRLIKLILSWLWAGGQCCHDLGRQLANQIGGAIAIYTLACVHKTLHMRQNVIILNNAMSEYLFVNAHANNSASLASVTLQSVGYSHTWNAVSQTPSVPSLQSAYQHQPGDLGPDTNNMSQRSCDRSDV